MNLTLNGVATALVLILLTGCGGPKLVPVQGIATRGGQPLKNLRITFYPAEGPASTADTDEDGHFELVHTKDQKGAILGKHRVTGVLMPRNAKEEMDLAAGKIKLHPEQEAIRQKFGKLESTPLTVEITKAETNLELKFD